MIYQPKTLCKETRIPSSLIPVSLEYGKMPLRTVIGIQDVSEWHSKVYLGMNDNEYFQMLKV